MAVATEKQPNLETSLLCRCEHGKMVEWFLIGSPCYSTHPGMAHSEKAYLPTLAPWLLVHNYQLSPSSAWPHPCSLTHLYLEVWLCLFVVLYSWVAVFEEEWHSSTTQSK